MKTIYLVRHGKAVSMDGSILDFDRTLLEQGENDSILVGERLKELKIKPALIITSPAARALKSAKLIAKQLDYLQKSIRTRKSLYEQSEDAILTIIHEIDTMHDSVMLVGHNPSFTDFAQNFAKGFKMDIPTGGVVGIKFTTKKWENISKKKGVLKLQVFPDKVRKAVIKRLIINNLEKKITENIAEVLEDFEKGSAEKIMIAVSKSSKKIAKEYVKNVKRKNINDISILKIIE